MSEVRISSIRFEKGCMVIACDWPGDYFSISLGPGAGYVVFSRLSSGVFQSSAAFPAHFSPEAMPNVGDCSFRLLESTSPNEACLEKSMDEIKRAIAQVRDDIRDLNVARYGIAQLKDPWHGRF